MNKLEKALKKAKEGTTSESSVDLQVQDKKELVSPSVEEEFVAPKYTQTRVVKVNLMDLKKNKIICAFENNKVYEFYRFLRTQILQRTQDKGWNSLLITSALPQEGKTIVAINLAITFAKEVTKTVLLVDSDLRNPSVVKKFNINESKGLSDYLLDRNISLSSLLINPGIEKLVILPGGKPVSDATEILDSPRMKSLVQEMKNRYPNRYIFFDSPPLLSCADALVLASYVDAVLLVVEGYRTTKQQFQRAMELLQDKPVLGIILNKMPPDEITSIHYY